MDQFISNLKFSVLFTFFILQINGQNNRISMNVVLSSENKTLLISEKITYYNRSQTPLNTIYFHDWNHAFSDVNSPLGKRFLENYNNKFFFSAEKNRGYTNIKNFLINGESVIWKREPHHIDQIEIQLSRLLQPDESIEFQIEYVVKIPDDKYTKYGVGNDAFNLKYWYILPAVYRDGWQLQSHLNLDNLYTDTTDYFIDLHLDSPYDVQSNLNIEKIDSLNFELTGKDVTDLELIISKKKEFETFYADSLEIVTNLNGFEIGSQLKKDLLTRQINFISDYLGKYPHHKILVNKIVYEKNPIYGFNQVPNFLRPFPDVFEWDIRMLQTLSKSFLDQSNQTNTIRNNWLREGIPYYILYDYVQKFYPEKKLIGNISKIWGIKSFYFSQLGFNDRYLLGTQYSTHYNLDQPLNTPIDSLTNFNREVANRFKTVLLMKHLDEYLGDSIVKNGIKSFFEKNKINEKDNDAFEHFIAENTTKNVEWFFTDLINSRKNIDFKITKTKLEKDSLQIQIKSNCEKVPVSLTGINAENKKTVYWIENYDLKTIKLPFKNEHTWCLNYNQFTPEENFKNNYKRDKAKKIRINLIKDFEDPEKNQILLEFKTFYNYYDGIVLGTSFSNKNIFRKPLEVRISPSYSTKSNDLTGSFSMNYIKFFDNLPLNYINFGTSGSYYHYKPDLAYRSLSFWGNLNFKSDNVRQPTYNNLGYTLLLIDKEKGLNATEVNKYNILLLKYNYNRPRMVENFSFNTEIEIENSFSKLSSELKFRRLIGVNQQFEMRLFAGSFLHNSTNGDYFSFATNRPTDYLFRYKYIGQSESSGVLSQQFIMSDGGFKSEMPVKFANQWITSMNLSIGLWKWFELYTDLGLAKNKNTNAYFLHDKGIRFNFIQNYFELYFPVHSNNGWEIGQDDYLERIRFVFSADLKSILNYIKRRQ